MCVKRLSLKGDRWVEEKENFDYEPDCKFKIDECGFFISWKSEGKEGDAWELSTVNDVRPGAKPQEARYHQLLVKKHGEDVYDKSAVVCSGVDMVDINFLNIVFKDKPTAEAWKLGIRKLTNNVKMNNVCPKTNLQKQ